MSTRPVPQLTVRLASWSTESVADWSGFLASARVADEAGVDRITVSDHVVFGERLDEYGKPEVGGTAGGKQPTGPDGAWLDPLTTLAVIAGQTKRVRLSTAIIIAALRRPVTLAKECATLDVLSNGRLDLGVGVGWQREEYDAAGLPFDGRGHLLDQTLEVCQLLWRETRASYSGQGLEFKNIHQMPKPLQKGGVPIWVSGRINKMTVQRMARFGAGWIPWGDEAADVITHIPRMKEEVAKIGGDCSNAHFVGELPLVRDSAGEPDLARTMAGLEPLLKAGVTDFRTRLVLPTDRAAGVAKTRALVTAFRKAVGRPVED
jgi:probable F420-dependent oxidoreductase